MNPPTKDIDNNLNQDNAKVLTESHVSMPYLSEQGWLVFENNDSYESFIVNLSSISESEYENLSNNLGFQSSYSLYGNTFDSCVSSIQELNNSGDTLSLSEEFNANNFIFNDIDTENKNNSINSSILLKLINRDGFIQIENQLFKFEIDNGFIGHLNLNTYPNEVDNLIAGDWSNANINILTSDFATILDGTTKENGEEYLNAVEYLTENPNSKIHNEPTTPIGFVFGKRDVSRQKHSDPSSFFGTNINYKVVQKNLYNNYLVYFELNHDYKFKVSGAGGVAFNNTVTDFLRMKYLSNGSKIEYQPRRSSWVFKNHDYNTKTGQNKIDNSFNAYSGGRGLKMFDFTSKSESWTYSNLTLSAPIPTTTFVRKS